jgi:hypothetical protein
MCSVDLVVFLLPEYSSCACRKEYGQDQKSTHRNRPHQKHGKETNGRAGLDKMQGEGALHRSELHI